MNEFPSSRQYVLRLKKILIPEYQDNNSIDAKEASMDNESGLPPATRSAAEERAASVMEDSNQELDSAIDATEEGDNQTDDDNQTVNENQED